MFSDNPKGRIKINHFGTDFNLKKSKPINFQQISKVSIMIERKELGYTYPCTVVYEEKITMDWVKETSTHIIRCDTKAKTTGRGAWHYHNKETGSTAWHVGETIMSTIKGDKVYHMNEHETSWKEEFWQQTHEIEKDVS